MGIGFAYLMSLSSYAVTGTSMSFHLQPPLIVIVWLVAIATALVAAWLPARRAQSMSIIAALRYE